MRQPRHRWIADRTEPLECILARLGMNARSSIASGAVFVNRRRAERSDAVVRKGQCVEVFEPDRRAASGAARVLAQRDDLLAAYKPVGIPTEPDRHGRLSLRAILAEQLGVEEGTLHAASRLDIPVSGVVLLACGPAGQRHLSALREQGRIRRRYVGVATVIPEPTSGIWDTPIGGTAITRYATVGVASGRALVGLEPATGRLHQLRIHAANAGAPLLGDRAHGGPQRWVDADGSVSSIDRVALHAAWVMLPDYSGEIWRVAAEVPDDLKYLWRAWGGAEQDWNAACALETLG
jgi:23S rRNA-/tRNA-specific pseudouridylate synthase